MVYYNTRNMFDISYACPRNLRGKPSLKMPQVLLLLLRQSSSPWLSSSCSSPSSWSAWCSSSPSGRWVLSFSFWAHLVLSSSSCIMILVCAHLYSFESNLQEQGLGVQLMELVNGFVSPQYFSMGFLFPRHLFKYKIIISRLDYDLKLQIPGSITFSTCLPCLLLFLDRVTVITLSNRQTIMFMVAITIHHDLNHKSLSQNPKIQILTTL